MISIRLNIRFFAPILLFLLSALNIFADMKYMPICFELSTDKEFYSEGEKITFLITIKNKDRNNSFPVLLPHTQNKGQKLFYLNLYDKANNTLLLRASEDRMMDMKFPDSGTVQIRYLEPSEEIVIPVYLNDFENNNNYYIQNSSHHSFGVPVFAGQYKVNICYNPNGIVQGDSIYSYYSDTDEEIPQGKLAIPSDGECSNMVTLKIRRSKDTIVSIEGKKYYIKSDGDRYFYFSENVSQIVTDLRCIHITNLPADSFSLPKGEYFYSHFTDLYAEYIVRYDDGDIMEYRKFSDYCPEYLLTERYNELKQKTFFACQLPDRRFYSISYSQPGNKILEESYCTEDGTQCTEIKYVYGKTGEFLKKEISQTEPCIEVELDGKTRSYKKGILEISK